MFDHVDQAVLSNAFLWLDAHQRSNQARPLTVPVAGIAT
jgi:hypothetical protein